MLRLPPFEYHRPGSVAEAVALFAEYSPGAMYIGGGTDLVPNMKHRLFEPEHLVSLNRVREMRGFTVRNGSLRIGASESLAVVAAHPRVRQHFPALAKAAGQIAGPQLRNSGTIGGNLCLDTRCIYYNQTQFWRGALGYCLKKDGDLCHVTGVGRKCVAAHTADTPPVLATLGAIVELAGAGGKREIPIDDLFVTDGTWNSRRTADEIVVAVHVPDRSARLRQGYAKLRQRNSIDFPLLTVAVAVEMDGPQAAGPQSPDSTVRDIRGVVTALGARPRSLAGWRKIAGGRRLDDELIADLARRAHEQCRPLENIATDPVWRRAMVPIFVRRALEEARHPAVVDRA